MISGERVRLRHIDRSDLARYVNWLNDPEVREGLAMIVPISQAEEEIWFEASLEMDPIKQPFAIDVLEKDEWVHIGGCSFHNVDERSRQAEIGLLIGAKEFWGQGLGADAMNVLMQHGFDTLNFRRLYLRVFEFNERAIKLYQKLGFTQEGRLRQDCFRKGQYWDTILMGMLRSEWQDLSSKEE